MVRTASCLSGLLAGILLLNGCATSRKEATASLPASRPVEKPLLSATRSLPVPPEEPANKIEPQPATIPEQQQARETPATTLRKLLPKTFVVLEVTPTTLLVKSSAPTESPSLFEEAIALSKLRGTLIARPAIPKETPQKTKLQNGTATIPFGISVPPSEAASAVVAALSVNGVQRVRAVLGTD